MATYTVVLRSVGNPDFGQYAPLSPPKRVKARKLSEIREACRSYIVKWDLGGGNFPRCAVRRNGKVVGHFSYNGRFWRASESDRREAERPRTGPDPIGTLPVAECRDRLRRIREILWPEEEPDQSWTMDHLDLIGEILEDLRLPTIHCKFCGREAYVPRCHAHQGGWVGPCCWDERLRTTE